MPRVSSYTYDPAKGEWTKSTVTTEDGSQSSDSVDTNGDNLTSSTSDQDSSTGSVEQEFNKIEINTLTGTLNFIVTEETIKLKAGDTVKLSGLGKYLSGNYYVKDITRQISSSGYSNSATLIKTDFGSSLKVSSSTTTKKAQEKKVQSTPSSASTVAVRTHTVKKGDNLWAISRKYYGNGKYYTRIYEANRDKLAKPDSIIYPGQVFIIP